MARAGKILQAPALGGQIRGEDRRLRQRPARERLRARPRREPRRARRSRFAGRPAARPSETGLARAFLGDARGLAALRRAVRRVLAREGHAPGPAVARRRRSDAGPAQAPALRVHARGAAMAPRKAAPATTRPAAPRRAETGATPPRRPRRSRAATSVIIADPRGDREGSCARRAVRPAHARAARAALAGAARRPAARPQAHDPS